MKSTFTKMFTLNTLFSKLLVVSLCCMIVPMLASSLYSIMSTTNNLKERGREELIAAAKDKQILLEASLTNLVNEAQSVADDLYLADYIKELETKKKLTP
ncbi:hypothetical protein [Paenibacillus hexagrammi]|uniref:Methyl-accepting chemotaxis protein n=1 Tax=Paenibacillus hexagrammi TaxID=2908839 RepID=A0ABY3SK42_9BACL|nr:hypothetical protein [Paenibacillus sp. YPD9-1]UJF33609.1 hypothetical protein L0M14_29700 [Paenibacillus sp. YPD9-1]